MRKCNDVMGGQITFFKNISKHSLGQEEYAYLSQYDYAITPKVSDCIVVAVKFRENNGKESEIIGHFETKNFVNPGAFRPAVGIDDATNPNLITNLKLIPHPKNINECSFI